MSTSAQVCANQKNAQHSTGPTALLLLEKMAQHLAVWNARAGNTCWCQEVQLCFAYHFC